MEMNQNRFTIVPLYVDCSYDCDLSTPLSYLNDVSNPHLLFHRLLSVPVTDEPGLDNAYWMSHTSICRRICSSLDNESSQVSRADSKGHEQRAFVSITIGT